MALRIGDEVELSDGTWCVVVGVDAHGEAILQDPWGNLLTTCAAPEPAVAEAAVA